MERSLSSLPQVAFVIDLGGDGVMEDGCAGIGHLAQLFSGLRLPATWAVGSAAQASFLGGCDRNRDDIDLAISLHAVDHYSPKQFLAALDSRVAALRDATRTDYSLVVGDANELRKRASVLADNGISAILSSPDARTGPAAPRPLACGLWQLQASWEQPFPRRRWRSFLPRPSIARAVIAAGATCGTTFAVISAAQLGRQSTRSLHAIEKMLHEVANAVSSKRLAVVKLSEVVSGLMRHRKITPQRSILRRAA
ncbi:MAG: hypothetical protein MK171_12980 [Pirellulales bacterium]|nr:hypothetical protein [Pirellulales bacterium]